MESNHFSKLTASFFWKKTRRLWLGLLILVVFAIFVLVVVKPALIDFLNKKTETGHVLKSDSSKIIPLPSGKRTYEVITGSAKDFKIIQIDVDPLDVKKGETQEVTVLIEDARSSPAAEEGSVEAIVYQDNTSTPFSFLLKKTELFTASAVSTWSGSWTCEDSHDFKYMMNIVAKNNSEHSLDLSFR